MRYLIIFIMMLAADISFAQIFTIKEIKGADSSGYTFPVVVSSQKPDIAKKVNALFTQETAIDPTKKNPFENLNEDDFGYSVAVLNDRVMGITIEGSHVGAGLHITRNEFNMDMRTGTQVDWKKVFGPEGNTKLDKMLLKAWTAAVKTQINDEVYGDQYKACLVELEKATTVGGYQASFSENGISFWAGGCLEGTTYEYEADRRLGTFRYSYSQLLHVLTPYGYSLFIDPKNAPVQSLLKGMIDGKYAISLTLLPTEKEGIVSGVIVYDRIGEPINLGGTMTGNQLVLHELDGYGNPLSDIEVSWDGTKLTGSFTNLKSKKQMPFLAAIKNDYK